MPSVAKLPCDGYGTGSGGQCGQRCTSRKAAKVGATADRVNPVNVMTYQRFAVSGALLDVM